MSHTCQDYLEILSAWLDGEAEPQEIVQLQAHLQGCPSCQLQHEAMAGLGRDIRRPLPAEVDGEISSHQLAAGILREQPRWGRLIQSVAWNKVLPTGLVALWSLAILKLPWLFWVGYLVCGFLLFNAGARNARRWQHPAEAHCLRPWLQSALAPLGWTLTLLQFIPLAALLSADRPSGIVWSFRPSWIAAVAAGPALALLAITGVVFGMMQVAAPKTGKPLLSVPQGACLAAVLLWAVASCPKPYSIDFAELLATVVAALAVCSWALFRLGSSLGASVGQILASFAPRYPLSLILVDATVVGSATLVGLLGDGTGSWALNGLILHCFGNRPEQWLWPVVLWLWVVLCRTPLARLVELTQGRPGRWPLGMVLGLLAGATGSLWATGYRLPLTIRNTDLNTAGLTFMPAALLAGLLLGLLLARRNSLPTSPDRMTQLRQSLLLWLALPVLLMGGLGARFWSITRFPAQPPLARQILAESLQRRQIRPLPPQQNGYRFIQSEMKDGLAVAWPPRFLDGVQGSWKEHRPELEALLQRLQPNLQHVQQCLAVTGLQADDKNRLGVLGRRMTQVLELRAAGYLEAGQIDAALNDYLTALAWDTRWKGVCDGLYPAGDGQAYRFVSSIQDQVENLTHLLHQHPLSDAQCRQILHRLDGYTIDSNSFIYQLDDSYVGLLQYLDRDLAELPPALSAMAGRYAGWEQAQLTGAYLQRRQQIQQQPNSAPAAAYPLPGVLAPNWARDLERAELVCRENLNTIEALRALAALQLYRNEHGHDPEQLEAVEVYLTQPLHEYLSGGGKFHYAQGQLSTTMASQWEARKRPAGQSGDIIY